jgi:hypothetical protein
VTVEGRDWQEAPVGINWNSTTGAPMGEADGPSFTTDVKIPANAEPGVYTIYFVQDQLVARTSFEVTPAEPSAGSGGGSDDDGRSGQTSASTSGSGEQSSPSGGRTTGSTSGGGGGGGSATPGAGGAQTFANPSRGNDPAVSEPANSPAPPQSPAATRPGALAGSGGQAVFAGSMGIASPASEASPTPPVDQQPATMSSRAVSSDLYSGFKTSDEASLLPDVADSGPATAPFGNAGLIAAIFTLSLVALFGGFAVAELRRRRAVSRAV